MKLGGHIGIQGELRYLALHVNALKYNCLQTMVGEGNGFNPFVLPEEATEEFKQRMRGVDVYVHLPYIINPCEGDTRKRRFFKVTMKKYLQAAQSIGAKGVVLHPGYKKELSEAEAFKNAVGFMVETMEDVKLEFLIETDAGSKNGSAIGSPKFIEQLIANIRNPGNSVGMCIDTCHLWARGLNLWDEEIRTKFLKECSVPIKLVHLNAPDKECTLGSHLDRHNTPFEEFGLDSSGLVLDLIGKYPCILERRSLSVQKQDVEYIENLTRKEVGDGTAGVQEEDPNC